MNTLSRRAALALALAALLPAGGRAAPVPAGGDAKPAPSLEMVPADAAAFLHVRVAELWDSPFGQALQAAIAREAPQFQERAEKDIGTPPANIATFTFVVAKVDGPESTVALLTTRRPYDKAKVLAAEKVPAAPQTVAGLEVYTQAPRGRSHLIFPDDRHIIAIDGLNPDEAVAYVRRMQQTAARGAGDGPLRPALDRAAGKAVLAGGLHVRALPPLPPGAVPPPFDGLLPLLRAEWGAATAELGDTSALDVRVHFDAAGDAENGEKALQAGRKLLLDLVAQAEKAPLPRGSETTVLKLVYKEVKAALEGARVSRTGGDVQARLTTEALSTHRPGFAATLATAVRTAHEAADRTRASNNLKQIALAMHNYHASAGHFPAHAIYSKDGKTPLLSWRVAILPYVGQDNLYKQFKLDEPWDSEHNKKLVAQMPAIYLSPTAPPAQELGRTHYQVFVGGGAVFGAGPQGTPLAGITDGTSNTLMVVEAAEPVVWTKPDDLPYDPNKPLPKLGAKPGATYFLAFFGDGSVRPIRMDLKEKTLRALITANGGETIDHSELDPPH
jgi:hypothetical protein